MLVIFLLMALHPEVQKKAQEEIDRVVGPDRLAEFSDREALPYVESVINEVYRCVLFYPCTPLQPYIVAISDGMLLHP